MAQRLTEDLSNADFENLSKLEVWNCISCLKVFIDSDEHPGLNVVPKKLVNLFAGIEPQSYWMGPDQILCSGCAQRKGIPPTL